MNTNPSSHFRRQLSAAACLMLAPLAFGQTTKTTTTTTTREIETPRGRDVRVVEPTRTLKKSDRDFVEKAAKASMSEIAISRVAAQRTSNPDIRHFAQKMIEDHERATEEMSAFAANRGIALPAKDPAPDKWEKRDAKSFDKDYLDKMISDHRDVVKLFEKQSRDGVDVDATVFARKHLPKMQEHLQHALDLKRALSDKPDRR
jgi:putative membrane protein